MANINIELQDAIHAEIVAPSLMLSRTSIIIDPVTNSYSQFAPIIKYELSIGEYVDIENPVLLNNGKNSRLSTSGTGTCTISLYVEDKEGNYATDQITITIE